MTSRHRSLPLNERRNAPPRDNYLVTPIQAGKSPSDAGIFT